MKVRRTLPQVPTFAGGVIATSPRIEIPPPARPGHDGSVRAGVTVASCDVVLRLPDRVARTWQAGVVSSDLQPADVIAILLRRHQDNPTDLSGPCPPDGDAAITVTLPSETLADLDRLRDATGAASRSSLCAALVAGHLGDQ